MSGDEIPDDEKPNILVRLLSTVTPSPIRKSFAVKFGLVLLVMAVSIGGIGLLATDRITAETATNVENEYKNTSAQESDIIDEWFDRNRLTVQLLSGTERWTPDDEQELQTRLNTEEAKIEQQDIHGLTLVQQQEAGGTYEVKQSTILSSGTSMGEAREDFWGLGVTGDIGDLTQNDVLVSDTYRAEGDPGTPVVAFLSPVSGANERYLMVEVSVLEVKGSIRGGDGVGFTQVVNATGQIMIDGEAGNELGTYADSEAALEPVREGMQLRGSEQESGVIAEMGSSDVIGETYTVGYSPIENKDNWVVVTHAPRSEVFGFVQTISDWGLIASLGGVLLIGIVGTLLGYSTSTAIDRLTDKTEEMREGNLDVDLYTQRIDNIGRLYGGFAEMRDALQQQIEEAERARKEAEVSRAEALEMSNYLEEKAEEYSAIMQQCAAGDLTQRMAKDGENESMDTIATEFNEMIEELEKTTGQLKSYVDEVEEAGAEVETSASTVREASEQVADSIQTISDDAYDQKERLQDISETMDDVASRLEDFAGEHPEIDFGQSLDDIRSIASALDETADLSESTMAESENVAGAAEEQAAELNEVGERAADLQRYAQPLRDILERFETEAEHEFVFSVGPTGGAATPRSGGDDEDEDESADEQ